MSDATDFLPPGSPVDLDNCAREPIHLPGSIQPQGALLVARARDLVIEQASGNVAEHLGLALEAVLGQTIDDLLGAATAARLRALPPISTAPAGADGEPTIRPDRLVLGERRLDTHSFRPAPELVAIELEAAPAATEEPDALTTVARVSRWSSALKSAAGVDALVSTAAEALRDLTGFDRVWAYRFEADDHGVVVAEHRRDDLESFLGLHFPESDIPRQARALYLRNAVRVIADAGATVSKLVPIVNPTTDTWLDLSGSTLRAVSPMHITYLTNLGVRSSLSISLVVDGRLWGLLSAHHYAGPRQVPFSVRAQCELLATMTAMQLGTATELERTHQRLELQTSANRVLDAMAATESIIDGLVADEEALLGLCRAAGAVISIGEDRHLIGATPPAGEFDRLLAALASHEDDLVVLDAVAEAHPDLADLAGWASGIIGFRVSRRQNNWVLWLRPESIQEVTWANRDKELVRRDASGVMALGARESFERWAEKVSGHSQPWLPGEIDVVTALRGSLGGLLITHAERLARLNDELARSNAELDAFSYAAAHDLREPIRGIEQFAGFFLEDFGDVVTDEGRAQLETVLRLARRMDALLTSLLEYAQLGEARWQRAPVSLPELVDEVRELLVARIPAGVRIETEPMTVEADREGLRQLLLNLIWNAAKYGPPDGVIEIGTMSLAQAEGGTPRVRRSLIGDREPPVVFVRDHGIGIDPEHHEKVFELFLRLHGRGEFGGGSGAGLALSQRIVERHGGTIWIESAAGEGATFLFTLEPA